MPHRFSLPLPDLPFSIPHHPRIVSFWDTGAKRVHRTGKNRSILALCAVLCLLLSVSGRPVDCLMLEGKEQTRLIPLPLGQPLITRYLHSVERTPVDDIYHVMDGRLWQWQTRVRSHNAGLPWQAPPQGRFVNKTPWLILEGGHNSWPEIRLRVGNAQLGHNEMCWGQEGFQALYSIFPDQSLRLLPLRRPFATLERFLFAGFHPAPRWGK